jgi:hypothetical protein
VTSPIPRHTLLACAPIAAGLDAEAVGAALARGLQVGGAPAPDVLPLPKRPDAHPQLLAREDFDVRMLAARAVVLALARLAPRGLGGTLAFEIATRARQSGVPCYAVAARSTLDSFDARMLDLQVVLIASSTRELTDAGRKLAAIV